MLLVIDNYDSFTFNLVQLIGETWGPPHVVRNDAASLSELDALEPEALVVSPGPGTPSQAGLSMAAIRHHLGRIPILGVCLGHQCLAEVYGARTVRATTPTHGKVVEIQHRQEGLFEAVPTPFRAALYHSLMVDSATLPGRLEAVAWAEDGTTMALADPRVSAFGVQFHPESFLTTYGRQILFNFISCVRSWNKTSLPTG